MNPEHAPNPTSEREQQTTPEIYVASLADYNNGRLLGAWIDATIGSDAIHAEIQAMLARSDEPAPEEWAIHDYEGFGAKSLSEHEQIETVAILAEGIERHGAAFAAWVDFTGFEPVDWHYFDDAYLGEHSSLEAYAEEIIDDFGWDAELVRHIPIALRPYIKIDAAAMAQDMERGGEIFTVDSEEGIHVFSTRI